MFNWLEGQQYLDTGFVGVFATLMVVASILFNIMRANKGAKNLFIRRIAGLNAIDDAIGRATEMGRPVLMVPGIGPLDAISVQAVNIFAQITKSAAQFSTPVRLCCASAAVYAYAQEVIRDVYTEQGMNDRFMPETVQFVSDQQFAFAAGVSGMIHREKVAATFLLGQFFAESLIFAETSNAVGAIQVAGSTQSTQTPFFIAACDYVLIGDEFYAASAYMTRDPVLVGSLVGQDWAKIFVAGAIMLGTIGFSAEMTQQTDTHRDGNKMVPVSESSEGKRTTEKKKAADTAISRIFKPYIPEEMTKDKFKREKKPVPEGTEGGGE
ncbi:MAG: DUF6754 domain-containing protein [Fimbriimonadaceae bacterium]